MKRSSCLFLAVALTAWLSLPARADSILNSASSFAVLGGSTVTNTGTSHIDGDIGVSPGASVIGFGPGTISNGSIYTGSDPVAMQAHADAIIAFNFLSGEAAGTNLSGQNLGGMTLPPGVYTFDSGAQLTGALTLDTQGDPNAFFHFQIGTTFTVDALSSVITIGLAGAPSPNIFFTVGTSATVAGVTSLQGTLLAQASISLEDGTAILGRAIAIDGAVTMINNNISTAMIIPEPGTLSIIAAGLLGLVALQRRLSRSRQQ